MDGSSREDGPRERTRSQRADLPPSLPLPSLLLVLMQHQKAKHFKCRHCPRKLNTAGGLAVHVSQVHKLEPDKLDNTLPGRDGYDVEIFGMEGFPADTLKEYRRRKDEEAGIVPEAPTLKPVAKRPKYSTVPLSEAELQAQLAAHKALMSGAAAQALAAAASGPPTGPRIPPTGPSSMSSPYGLAPPSPYPGFQPPPQQPGMPPYPFPPPGMGMPPPGMGMPPPGGFRPPFPGFPGPPPGWQPG
ncbi:hypothetical protein BDY24DRAFT_341895 [Mrakia frigida]|uniref:C2H2-type zinc finger protein n=1 Tax=Mrakia frigida TaxID=29902 RepID=UPI003FCBFDF8